MNGNTSGANALRNLALHVISSDGPCCRAVQNCQKLADFTLQQALVHLTALTSLDFGRESTVTDETLKLVRRGSAARHTGKVRIQAACVRNVQLDMPAAGRQPCEASSPCYGSAGVAQGM